MKKNRVLFGNKKLWVLLGILCVTIIGLTIGIVMNLHNQKSDIQIQEKEETETETNELYEKEKEEAINQPTAEEYIVEIDRRISEAMDAESKAELYISRAEELYSRNNVGEGDFRKQILDDLYEAEEIAPSGKTAWMLYNFESLFGHSDIANRYYDLAIERGYKIEEDVYEE